MTDNRTTELLPCPFCSAKPELWADSRRTWGLVQHEDWCLFPSIRKHEIPEEDFAAWNTASGTLTAERLEKAKACKSSEELAAFAAELLAELDKGNNGECYLVYEGEKYPVELDFGFLGMMPITITVGGFRYLVEVPNGE